MVGLVLQTGNAQLIVLAKRTPGYTRTVRNTTPCMFFLPLNMINIFLNIDVPEHRSVFKTVWRMLRQDGWFSKPPPRRSLCDQYRYVRPRGNPDGQDGVDFFLGEQALIEHYQHAYGGSGSGDAFAACESNRGTNDGARAVSAERVRDGNEGIESYGQTGEAFRVCNQDYVDVSSCIGGSGRGEDVLSASIGTGGSGDLKTIGIQDDVGADQCGSLGGSIQGALDTALSAVDRSSAVGVRCAVCNLECSTERAYSRCKKPMHHFCSHDACKSLNISNSSGDVMEDFGDSCYCSK
ncbi:hypothetical protein PI124_g22144 [Phytophthora idaei]|nr:hypothetical protein PI125_g23533 [Phytophthora idaei]KAG3232778.1 hypothetical protein PI124_g22144 [Phytophthora idaei]